MAGFCNMQVLKVRYNSDLGVYLKAGPMVTDSHGHFIGQAAIVWNTVTITIAYRFSFFIINKIKVHATDTDKLNSRYIVLFTAEIDTWSSSSHCE